MREALERLGRGANGPMKTWRTRWLRVLSVGAGALLAVVLAGCEDGGSGSEAAAGSSAATGSTTVVSGSSSGRTIEGTSSGRAITGTFTTSASKTPP